jgi:hypothetical protein
MVILPFKSGPVFPGGVFFLSARYFCRTITYTDQKEGVAVRADNFLPIIAYFFVFCNLPYLKAFHGNLLNDRRKALCEAVFYIYSLLFFPLVARLVG